MMTLTSGCTALAGISDTALSGYAAYKAHQAANRPLWTSECVHKPVYVQDASSLTPSEKRALIALNATLKDCGD